MKLSELIKIWDIIHVKNIGHLGFCDLEKAVDETVGILNDCVSLEVIQARHASEAP